jgi:hypothetical protein
MTATLSWTIDHLDFDMATPCVMGGQLRDAETDQAEDDDCPNPAAYTVEAVGLCCNQPDPCCQAHRERIEALIEQHDQGVWVCMKHRKSVPMLGHTRFHPLNT